MCPQHLPVDGFTETFTLRILPAITPGTRKFVRLHVTSQ